ncbi:MAG: hypothetical protein WCY33_02775 [Clostridia bacterium]
MRRFNELQKLIDAAKVLQKCNIGNCMTEIRDAEYFAERDSKIPKMHSLQKTAYESLLDVCKDFPEENISEDNLFDVLSSCCDAVTDRLNTFQILGLAMEDLSLCYDNESGEENTVSKMRVAIWEKVHLYCVDVVRESWFWIHLDVSFEENDVTSWKIPYFSDPTEHPSLNANDYVREFQWVFDLQEMSNDYGKIEGWELLRDWLEDASQTKAIRRQFKSMWFEHVI